MPLITREVRWFFDGNLAAGGAATSAWFADAMVERQGSEAGRGAQPEDGRADDWRTDRYLLLPDTDEAGVKLRQGQLEIKGRHSLIGVQRFGDEREGEVACWTKWTLAAPEWTSTVWSAIEGKVSVCVAKLRMLCSMQFNEDGIIAAPAEQEAEPAPALPENSQDGAGGKRQWSLQMELTRIRLAGSDSDTHWSLAFEAHPDDPSCRVPFAKAVSTLLAGCPARPLNAQQSMSYPRWLQRLGAKITP